MTNCLTSFDVSTAAWEILSAHTDIYDISTPPSMYGSSIFYHNECLYILGGFQRCLDLETMYKYCLKTLKWSLMSQTGLTPFISFRVFGKIFKSQVYMFIGSSITRQNRFTYVNIFDFSTNTWTTRATSPKTQQYPNDRNDESFAFSDNFCYLCGGQNPQAYTYHYDIWRIDLETLEWVKLDYTLKKAMCFQCTSVVNDSHLYSFVGEGDGWDRQYSLQRFTVQPPTLCRICLESMSRSPSLRTHTKSLPGVVIDELDFEN
ncbi:Kelch domain-containing protein 10 [Thelohanellus kitauei]|uniref:Kelch domain-containing protein 10 n=1 Tax=Thelohanellus kitauei TaxID=669202 RepID=A0A0C2J8N0_THEKT|nr:Kelch domain-containing protein 10 [Thelohanellus kitauei]